MNNKQKEKWDNTKAKGYTPYLLVNGILKWGVPFAIGLYLSDIVFEILWAYWFNTQYQDRSGHLISKVIFGIVFGLIMGNISWSANEKAYEKSERTQN
jgi:hypothetical protein